VAERFNAPVLKTGVRKDSWVRIPPPPLLQDNDLQSVPGLVPVLDYMDDKDVSRFLSRVGVDATSQDVLELRGPTSDDLSRIIWRAPVRFYIGEISLDSEVGDPFLHAAAADAPILEQQPVPTPAPDATSRRQDRERKGRAMSGFQAPRDWVPRAVHDLTVREIELGPRFVGCLVSQRWLEFQGDAKQLPPCT
jgi:hypothetical protein